MLNRLRSFLEKTLTILSLIIIVLGLFLFIGICGSIEIEVLSIRQGMLAIAVTSLLIFEGMFSLWFMEQISR